MNRSSTGIEDDRKPSHPELRYSILTPTPAPSVSSVPTLVPSLDPPMNLPAPPPSRFVATFRYVADTVFGRIRRLSTTTSPSTKFSVLENLGPFNVLWISAKGPTTMTGRTR